MAALSDGLTSKQRAQRAYIQKLYRESRCVRCTKPLPAGYTGWRHYECERQQTIAKRRRMTA